MKVSQDNSRTHEVLIVDDITQNLQVIGNILYKKGIKITVATNGQQALDIVDIKQPDLILLDISMPGMDGLEVCKHLKDNEKTKNIPIIFLTARVENSDIVKGFQAGAVDYITKPFNLPELLARVNTHLEIQDQRRQLRTFNNQLEEQVKLRTNELDKANADLRSSNEDLLMLNGKLNKANRKLARLEKAKNDFMLLVNHELRTPLNGILGFTGILQRNIQKPQNIRYVEMINTSVSRLLELSELTLLITSLRADSYKTMIKVLKIGHLLSEVLEARQPLAEGKRIAFFYHQESADSLIKTDERLSLQCFSIVLNNALEHSPAGGRIDVSISKTSDIACVNIEDQGPGFPQEVVDHMFELFTAGDMKHHSKGFGLGLATAKLIMTTLGGNIEIYNKPGNGAVVKLCFRLAAATEAQGK